MPFDPRDPEPTPPPNGDPRAERLLLGLIVLLAFALVALPIGGGSIVDAVAYLMRR